MAAPTKMRILNKFCSLCCKSALPKQYTNRFRYLSTAVAAEVDDVVEYPPIKPRFPPGNWGHLPEKVAWRYHEEIQQLNEIVDVRERLERLGEKEQVLMQCNSAAVSANALDFQQYLTRTHLICDGQPDVYADLDVSAELELVRPLVISSILYTESSHCSKAVKQRPRQALTRMVSTLFSALAGRLDFLRRAQVDENVVLKTFWWRHGFDPDKHFRGQDNKHGIWKFQAEDIIDFQIRTELPLPQFIPCEADECQKGALPSVNYSPLHLTPKILTRKPITVSGHWISDPCEFGHTSFFQQKVLTRSKRTNLSSAQYERSVLSEGVIKSFCSTLAQAYNQGFNMLQDITYPFTAQTVLTDGRNFSFFSYQLNTIHLWLKEEHQPLRNVCWASPQMALYEKVENGEVVGFNDNVLSHLLKFMKLPPGDRGVDLRPNLSEKSPREKKLFINHKGTPAIPQAKIGRWQYPRNAQYF